MGSQMMPIASSAAAVSQIAVPVDQLSDKILAIKKLLDAGAITQEEFDQQKGQLLGEIIA